MTCGVLVVFMVSASEAMTDAGYTSQIISMTHDAYGGCTTRLRVYLVSAHAEACGVSQAAAVDIVAKIAAKAKQARKQIKRREEKKTKKKAKELKLPSKDFKEFMLPDDHPYLQGLKEKAESTDIQAANCSISWLLISCFLYEKDVGAC